MPNPFSKNRIPPVQRIAPEPEVVPEVLETPEEEVGELINPAKVLYNTNRCNSCEYFLEEGGPCRKVSGPISGEGWCVLHEAKVEAEPSLEGAIPSPEEAL